MPRLLANPRFWVMAVVLTWLVVITLLIALDPSVAPSGAGATQPR